MSMAIKTDDELIAEVMAGERGLKEQEFEVIDSLVTTVDDDMRIVYVVYKLHRAAFTTGKGLEIPAQNEVRWVVRSTAPESRGGGGRASGIA